MTAGKMKPIEVLAVLNALIAAVCVVAQSGSVLYGVAVFAGIMAIVLAIRADTP